MFGVKNFIIHFESEVLVGRLARWFKPRTTSILFNFFVVVIYIIGVECPYRVVFLLNEFYVLLQLWSGVQIVCCPLLFPKL